MYPEQLVLPMKEELTDNGFQDLTTPEQVEEALQKPGTTLAFINSVCGCAAGAARPGVLIALALSAKKPDNKVTVFAGFDYEAVDKMREHLLPYPPSSPSIALFKDGKLVHFVERHDIEGYTAQMIGEGLATAMDTHC
ncbi:MAG TPA: BrxA/BrxB family bacilliredoxin [Ginsengibacter sp.]|nr:BrxA/BrxB family bacilliredoxin [Chitinophagaceae bacterium]MCW5913356.1 BrxA/BrxB family bacilliredoxin [Chitinophagaceae bacterium]MCZ2395888.1 BrxA/BrxB family bacilliredoxin [Chitinophagales bacterium]HRN73434.1 BrxA/BrxB family bacilliredoxin [Ginsengibacter sp.]HUN01393.1 BrxA/BrxB family bacilliredoxin [Niabella sp.]